MSATLRDSKPTQRTSRNGKGKGQSATEAHDAVALPVLLDPGQGGCESHTWRAGVDLALSQTIGEPQDEPAEGDLDGRHARTGSQKLGASDAAPEARTTTEAQNHSGSGAAALLALTAATLDDLERTRIATQNRLRAMRDDQGLGETPEYEAIAALHDTLALAEHQAELTLKRALRKHPLHKWVKATIGVGEKQAARLLAAVDDPATKPAQYDRETGELIESERPRRGPAEFWQYCGHGDPERSRRRKGQRVEFSPAAKMRTHLIAESCIKQAHSPYRAVYDAARASWADRETSDGHKHNHALRLVGKAFLRDLFLAAKEAA